jgi:hypothetical protein
MASPSAPAGEPSGRHEKVTAFVSRSASAEPKVAAVTTTHAEDLDAFGSEEAKQAPEAVASPIRSMVPPGPLLAILAAAVGVAAVVIGLWMFAPSFLRGAPASTPGRLTIGTTPIGIAVTIDGQAQGLTPLTVQLDPGSHIVKLQRGTEERTISVQVSSGVEMTQHYEFAPQPAPLPLTSTLTVTTDPPGARVLIDGEARGNSPVTVPDLTAARHRVTVIGENGSVERQVTTEAGVTSSVVFSLPRVPAMTAGWLSVTSPFEVQIVERGEVIGTSASPRFMVPAGSHEVDLVNDALGFKEHRKIDITQNATAAVKVDARATVSANARPWAEVIIDGRSMGQTPLANLSLTLGTHQIVFRHPELGERQQTLLVTAKGPNRISVDLSR